MGQPTGNRDHVIKWSEWYDPDFRNGYDGRRLQYQLVGDHAHFQHTLCQRIQSWLSHHRGADVSGSETIHSRDNHISRDSYRFDGNVELWSDYL